MKNIQKIGICGYSGRVGQLLSQLIQAHPSYELGTGFAARTTQMHSLEMLFEENDFLVDFSVQELVGELLKAALKNPKPLAICTTGWTRSDVDASLTALAKQVAIIIAPNTSIGACLQTYFAVQVAKILGTEYDIDILEAHHRQKKDTPSGTAHHLFQRIQEAKKQSQQLEYTLYTPRQGPRLSSSISLSAQRSGQLPGTHQVSFTGSEEQLSITHQAFDRSLFARGALKIIEWYAQKHPPAGIYGMEDVLGLS